MCFTNTNVSKNVKLDCCRWSLCENSRRTWGQRFQAVLINVHRPSCSRQKQLNSVHQPKYKQFPTMQLRPQIVLLWKSSLHTRHSLLLRNEKRSRFSFPFQSPDDENHIVEHLPSSTFWWFNLDLATGHQTGQTYHVFHVLFQMEWSDQQLSSLAVRNKSNQWKVQMMFDSQKRRLNGFDLFHAGFSVSSAKNKTPC